MASPVVAPQTPPRGGYGCRQGSLSPGDPTSPCEPPRGPAATLVAPVPIPCSRLPQPPSPPRTSSSTASSSPGWVSGGRGAAGQAGGHPWVPHGWSRVSSRRGRAAAEPGGEVGASPAPADPRLPRGRPQGLPGHLQPEHPRHAREHPPPCPQPPLVPRPAPAPRPAPSPLPAPTAAPPAPTCTRTPTCTRHHAPSPSLLLHPNLYPEL